MDFAVETTLGIKVMSLNLLCRRKRAGYLAGAFDRSAINSLDGSGLGFGLPGSGFASGTATLLLPLCSPAH